MHFVTSVKYHATTGRIFFSSSPLYSQHPLRRNIHTLSALSIRAIIIISLHLSNITALGEETALHTILHRPRRCHVVTHFETYPLARRVSIRSHSSPCISIRSLSGTAHSWDIFICVGFFHSRAFHISFHLSRQRLHYLPHWISVPFGLVTNGYQIQRDIHSLQQRRVVRVALHLKRYTAQEVRRGWHERLYTRAHVSDRQHLRSLTIIASSPKDDLVRTLTHLVRSTIGSHLLHHFTRNV